jgi:predicted DsbA family dithiol-disulfide isomerase
MRIEVWSDVVCPWCFLGKRRLEQALARFPSADRVEVFWRSFELDPDAPRRRKDSAAEHLARKYGMSQEQVGAAWARLTELAAAEGLTYHLERTQGGSSFDAHRLLHLAAEHGLQNELKERLMHAYFTEGAALGEPEVLAGIAAQSGLPQDETADVLAGDRYTAEVRSDEERARELGVRGVPFFVVDNRYGISGAQSSELLLEAITTAWAERRLESADTPG